MCQAAPDLHQAYELTQELVAMLKERKGSSLQDWMRHVEHSGLPALKGFARGLQRDYVAVAAAFSSPWSQGQNVLHGALSAHRFLHELADPCL
jgi:transposase